MRLLKLKPHHAQALLRIAAALLFVEAGVFHLLHWPASPMPPAPPEMATILTAAGLFEVVGGSLLVLGFMTRPTAFVLSGMMAIAYWGFHAPMGAWPVTNMGAPAILYCFIFLFLSAAGPGALAVDNGRHTQVDARA